MRATAVFRERASPTLKLSRWSHHGFFGWGVFSVVLTFANPSKCGQVRAFRRAILRRLVSGELRMERKTDYGAGNNGSRAGAAVCRRIEAL